MYYLNAIFNPWGRALLDMWVPLLRLVLWSLSAISNGRRNARWTISSSLTLEVARSIKLGLYFMNLILSIASTHIITNLLKSYLINRLIIQSIRLLIINKKDIFYLFSNHNIFLHFYFIRNLLLFSYFCIFIEYVKLYCKNKFNK